MSENPSTSASEFFFLDGQGKKKDAELHEPILAEGDAEAAEAVSRAVMLRLGVKPERIDALMAKARAFDPSEPRDDEGKWTDESGGDEHWADVKESLSDPAVVEKRWTDGYDVSATPKLEPGDPRMVEYKWKGSAYTSRIKFADEAAQKKSEGGFKPGWRAIETVSMKESPVAKAFTDYSVNEAAIQSSARGNLQGLKGDQKVRLDESVKLIDGAIAESRTNRDSVLYRGVGKDYGPEHYRDKVGKVVTLDDGFVSTTKSEEVAKSFARRYKSKYIYEMKVPKGARAVDLSSMLADLIKTRHGFVPGNEVLLQRGTQALVERVTKDRVYLRVLAETVKKAFDPSEPRDEEGKWTDGDGGESAPDVPETAAFEPQWDKIKNDETASRLQFAIQKWVSEDFVEINHALRKGGLGRDDERDRAIKSLDDAFQYAVATPRDYLVYRGMGPSHHTVGEEWQDKGFVSTSSSWSVANEFAETNGGYLVEVTIPKGTKLIAPMVSPDKDRRIYEEDQEGAEIVRNESELTLPRGTRFKITGKRHDVGSDQTIFQARVVT